MYQHLSHTTFKRKGTLHIPKSDISDEEITLTDLVFIYDTYMLVEVVSTVEVQ